MTAHVQYGPRIRAGAIYLNAQHLIPEDRVGEVMRDLFGAPLLCPASIAAWGEGKAREWASLEAEIAQRVATASVRHLDETGFRIAAKTRWLHTDHGKDSRRILTHRRRTPELALFRRYRARRGRTLNPSEACAAERNRKAA